MEINKLSNILHVIEQGNSLSVEVLTFIKELLSIIESQSKEIDNLKAEIKVLQDQLKLDSHNSSNPPSSDKSHNRKVKKRVREKSKKSPGGQKGHLGRTLEKVDTPDHVIIQKLDRCSGCGCDLSENPVDAKDTRQIFDIPPLKLEVTEYQSEIKTCPHCGLTNKASFPDGVEQPTQYGSNVKGFLTYLNAYQLLPYERTCEMFEDLFDHPISQGTLLNTNQVAYENLEAPENFIKEQVIHSKVIHCDETGVYENKKRNWLHVASTSTHTFYFSHPKRGKEAMNAADVLPNFDGVAVHDHWKSYNGYDNCGHAYCNSHHLRELIRAEEQDDATWAKEMKELLLEIKATVDAAKDNGKNPLSPLELTSFHEKYREILAGGFKKYPDNSGNAPPQKGKKAQSKEKNLLDRLEKYETETLRFMHNFDVPFDNNLAERDLRMMKVKQKISGCFRSNQGTKQFCRIRGFISTIKKQGKPILTALKTVFHSPNHIIPLLQTDRAV
jgi:transposase